MKVSVVRGGGLAGVATGTAVSSDSLPPEEADKLKRKVEEAGVLDAPDQEPGRPSHPDELSYGLTVEHEGVKRTVTLREGEVPDPVRGLISWIDQHPDREEWVGSPGGGK